MIPPQSPEIWRQNLSSILDRGEFTEIRGIWETVGRVILAWILEHLPGKHIWAKLEPVMSRIGQWIEWSIWGIVFLTLAFLIIYVLRKSTKFPTAANAGLIPLTRNPATEPVEKLRIELADSLASGAWLKAVRTRYLLAVQVWHEGGLLEFRSSTSLGDIEAQIGSSQPARRPLLCGLTSSMNIWLYGGRSPNRDDYSRLDADLAALKA